MAYPTWNTLAGSIGSFVENVAMSYTFSATPGVGGNTITYSLLNGSVPSGTSLNSTGVLSGTPAAVNSNTTSEFTIRATESNGTISDRTFTAVVTGATVPTWVTAAGSLLSTNDSTWVSTQLSATSSDPDTTVVYSLQTGSSLPDGLEINTSGLIRGYATPPATATATTTFTVVATSASGSTPRTFSITVLNQELNYVGVFPGRAPALLNNQSLTFVIPTTDPYYSYYISGTSIGKFDQTTDLIFKMIGYNFDAPVDEDAYLYDLSYSITDTTPAGAFSPIVSPASLPGSAFEGWLNGTLATIGTSINSYSFSVTASRTSNPALVSATKTFTFVIVGTISDTIEWVTPSDLGSIDNGAICDLAVVATFGSGVTDGSYRLVSGSLPPGLEVLSNGSISGRVEFNLASYSTYTFTVEAYSPTYPTLITSTRQFTLAVIQKYTAPYDTLYMKGLLTSADRLKIAGLLANITATQSANIYRSTDAYFGVAKDVIYQHQYGVPSVSDIAVGNPNYFYDQYIAAIQKNFYWRYITLGTLKTAVAKDSNGVIIYEVVYSEIIDDLVNSKGQSISKEVGFPNDITTSSGPYWTSWTSIYTSNTYYDLISLAKQIVTATTASTTAVLNNVTDLVVGMQITGFPGVTIVNQADGTPPVLTVINTGTNTITLNVAQTFTAKDQIIFNDPINVTYTDVRQSTNGLYPNSLPNMRTQIEDMIGQFDNTTLIPRWMDSQQANGSVLGYVPCWVLCYTKPGKSADVLGTLNTTTGLYPTGSINKYLVDYNLTLNQIGFEIDRFEIDRSLTYTYGQSVFNTWPATPSDSVNNDSRNVFMNFPKKTILG